MTEGHNSIVSEFDAAGGFVWTSPAASTRWFSRRVHTEAIRRRVYTAAIHGQKADGLTELEAINNVLDLVSVERIKLADRKLTVDV